MPPYGIAQFFDQVYSDPYNITAEDKIIQQPMGNSVLDQGIPFALPNLNYRNYDLSNLFNTTEPDLNNSALARRLMTQPGLDKFTGINKGVYDPYGIKVEDGRFSYDMNKTSLADYQKPRSLGFDTSYGVANEPDDTQSQEYIDQVKKSQSGGLGGLFRFLLGLAVPGAGFLMNLPGKGLEGIRSLNQRLRATDFGQSRTLAEYAMKRRERKQAERAQEAMPEVYRSAKEQGFTNDRGGFSTNRADRAGTSVGSGQFSPSTSRGRSGY